MVFYGLNQDKLFVPGSVTKLVIEGTVLQLFNQQYFLNGKGLAGYLDVPSGDRLVVAIFLNNAHGGDSMKSVLKIGDALGEIASVTYTSQ